MDHILKADQVFASRYRIERFLAEGGMGAVFVGEHTGTEQRVAVKVLWPHVLASQDAVEKFKLEARVAGRVSSDHIVRVIDAGFDDESRMPFLVMELLNGQTLDALVSEGGPLPPATLMELMNQVASGLDKAHGYVDKDGNSTPIVHRDLKPENLFLTRRDSGEPLMKILDFGIAKVVSEGNQVSQEIKGTPLFMAFEQAGGGRITPRTDVWALGLIVFWLLTGKHYWRSAQDDSGGITRLFGEVLAIPITSATERAHEFGVAPPWLPTFDDWFTRCVNRDQNLRFASAGEALAALGETLVIDSSATMRMPQLFHAPSISARATVAGAVTALDASISTTAVKPAGIAGYGPAVKVVAMGAVFAVGLGSWLLLRKSSPPQRTNVASLSVSSPATASSAPSAASTLPPIPVAPVAASSTVDPSIAPLVVAPASSFQGNGPPRRKNSESPIAEPGVRTRAAPPPLTAGPSAVTTKQDTYGDR